MEFYWGNNLIKKTNSKSKSGLERLVFVPNLKLFIYNNRDKYDFDFDNSFAINKNEQDATRCLEIGSKDGSILWRQIDGCETQKDLEEWYLIFSAGKQRWSYLYFENSIIKMCEKWLKSFLTPETGEVYTDKNGRVRKEKKCVVKPPKYDLCYNNEKLYLALSSAYLNGYSVMNAEPQVIYDDLYFYDTSANHSSFMYYFKYPKRFTEVERTRFKEFYFGKKNYYGEFCFYLKKDHPYLKKFPQYDAASHSYIGWANDVDVEFLKELVGIEGFICYNLYEVEMDFLPQDLRKAIYGLYKRRDKKREELRIAKKEGKPTSLLEKQCELYKNCLEKLYGNCAAKRWYKNTTKWDEKKGKYEQVPKPYHWEDIELKDDKGNEIGTEKGVNSHLKNDFKLRWDYSIGVWTTSYARLQGLKIEKALKSVGAKHLYSDIDCHVWQGKQGLKVIEAFNKSIGGDLMLGKFKSELKDDDGNPLTGRGKFECEKWYCIQDTQGKIKAATAGADNAIVVAYLKTCEDPVKAFSKHFPPNVKPYKQLKKNENGKYYHEWASSWEPDLDKED